MMKYGIYDVGESPSSLEEYVDGAHIFVLRTPSDYLSTTVSLEDDGWEVRDCIKIIFEENSIQAGLFRKPFKGTVASNVIKNGCGGINIDACRVGTIVQDTSKNGRGADKHKSTIYESGLKKDFEGKITVGRFPANLILSPYASKLMDEQAPVAGNLFKAQRKKDTSGGSGVSWTNGGKEAGEGNGHYDEPGGASRFFFRFEEREEMMEYLETMIRC
jgi:hypothetical protein